MNIAVVGLWHLGTVTAACLAAVDYTVIGFDEDSNTISSLQQSRLPVFEPGLENLIRREMANGRLHFSSDPNDLARAETIWITYDTPVDENDVADTQYVIDRIAGIFPYIGQEPLVVISSQLPAGSTRRLEAMYNGIIPEGRATFAYSPENLRLGRAIEAFMRPERVVVGVDATTTKERIALLLRPLTERIEWMSIESAEMTKHALNAFLATSVAFINELATLCERVGADVKEVGRGLKSDPRIGPKAYLRPGGAFAGGTLARDLSFLADLGRTQELPTHLLSGVRLSNDAHQHWPWRRLVEVLGTLHGKSIAVLGLTYKPGTDTLRRSSAVETCRWLNEQGAFVVAYDPAVRALPAELTRFIELRSSIEEALRGVAAVLVATEWPEFRSIRADDLVVWMQKPIILDPGGFLATHLSGETRIRYLALGRAE